MSGERDGERPAPPPRVWEAGVAGQAKLGMPERLPSGLRLLYDVARIVARGAAAPEDVLAEVAVRVQGAFHFRSVRFVHAEDGPEDEPVLAEAAELRAAAERGEQVAVPLAIEGHPAGFLVAESAEDGHRLDDDDLQLLSAVGLVAGVLLEKAVQQRELQQAMDELLRVDELKEEFASVASHELRTPIAVVHGIATTLHLRHDALDADQRRELRRALFEQSERLVELAEQLLDLSRLDAGRLDVELQSVRPRGIVDELVARLEPRVAEQVEIAIEPGCEIVSDAEAVERVVGNLLANAFKYGRPPVRIAGGEQGGRFRIAVEDRGPGVEPEFASQLFDRFSRSDLSRRSPTTGAGLGLAIAQRYADAVSGTLAYERVAPEGGARFVLSLPA